MFQLLEPGLQVCEVIAHDNTFLGRELLGSHVWLTGGRIKTFELAFPISAYAPLLEVLTSAAGQPQPVARLDRTESSMGWRVGDARLSLTRSPQRNLVVMFVTFQPSYSEEWRSERAFSGYYTARIPIGTDPPPTSFAGCYFTMSPAASEAFYRAHPDAQQIQAPGRPHYWLEIRGTRRDIGPGSEHAESNIFPCEIRATRILSSTRLERVEFYPNRGFETEERLQARRAASDVIVLTVDHVLLAGTICRVDGRVVRVENGSAFRTSAGGTLLQGHVPCGNPLSLGPREVAVGDLRRDGLIRLYLQPRPPAETGTGGANRMVLLDAELLPSE